MKTHSKPFSVYQYSSSRVWISMLIALTWALSVPTARATITVVSWWRLGENDSGAIAGGAASTATDSAGSNNLTYSNNAFYSSDVATSAQIHVGSIRSVNFSGVGGYATGGLVSTALDNFGIEAWVKPASATNNFTIAYDGVTSNNGWGLCINGNSSSYYALLGGVALFGASPVTSNVWTHVALVRSNGVATFYVNGLANGAITLAPILPTGNFAIGAPPQNPSSQPFTGSVDEVRVFKFVPAQFSLNDLLINQQIAPQNDDFSNSIVLAGTAYGENDNATIEAGEPNTGGGIVTATNTVWWQWTAPTNGPASVQTYGSGLDTIIDVYTGSVLKSLLCVASNLNTVLNYELYYQNPENGVYSPFNGGLTNRLEFTAVAGTKYQIQVSGLTEGPIDIAVQPVALKVLSVNSLVTNGDSSINFKTTIAAGNSGPVTSGPLRLQLFARAGYSYDPNAFELNISPPADQVLTNYYISGSLGATPGTITNISLSGICPAPVEEASGSYTNIGYGWAIFAALQEQFGTNWFSRDNDLLFYGLWPAVDGVPGPQSGVINVYPSGGGSFPYFTGASINGPALVYQHSTTNYYGTATFEDGGGNIYRVNFTNTLWTASKFSIATNGVFQAGAVTTNTPLTLTAYYTYDGSSGTNASQLNVLVLAATNPFLSNSLAHTNKTFSLALNALPGTKFEIETATNVSNPQWLPLATNVTDANGVWFYTDTKATNQSRRFYRALETQ
jgi:hypothetical protein